MSKTNNQDQASKLEVYELAMLVDPKLSEDKVADKIDSVGKIVAQESGSVLSSGNPTMRNLAYEMTIKHEGKRSDYNKAYFTWIKFEQLPESLSTIELSLKADKDIVRHLIIKTTREDHVVALTDEIEPEDEVDEVDEAEEVEDEVESEDEVSDED